MHKNLATFVTAATLVLSLTGSAFATFADLRLIRVYYDRAGAEIATDLGNVKELTASGATIPGSFGSISTGFAVYYAINRVDPVTGIGQNEMWATGLASPPTLINGTANGMTAFKNGTTSMYVGYNSQGGTNYTGLASATNSYRNKLSASQGNLANSINATYRLNTEISITALIGASSGSVTQTLYYWSNGLTTVNAEKVGVAVATITTNFDGSTTITAGGSTNPLNGVCGSSNTQSFDVIPSVNLCSAGDASAVTGSGPWSWSCAGQNGGTTASCSASINTYPLTVTLAGDGSGSVNSDPSGINCSGGAGSACPGASFNYGAPVTLTAAESAGSVFSGWSGTGSCIAIPATQSCTATMNGAQDIIATFSSLHLIRIGSTSPLYYDTLQNAFDDTRTLSGDTIQTQAATFNESSLTLGRSINLTLMGGFDSSYALNAGYTTIQGPLVIQNGSLTVDRIIIL